MGGKWEKDEERFRDLRIERRNIIIEGEFKWNGIVNILRKKGEEGFKKDFWREGKWEIWRFMSGGRK